MSVVSRHLRLLAASCHLAPALTVTALAAALAAGRRLPPARAGAVAATVLTGQLTIGWGNDLVDAARDRVAGRADKPLAVPGVSPLPVQLALVAAGGATVALGARCGPEAGLVHAALVVGPGWAYNAGLKGTRWSLLPYAVAFGALPHVVALADPRHPAAGPAWQSCAGALLGCSAHLLDALPDLEVDRATGVRGYPHRFRAGWLRAQATAALLLAHLLVLRGTRCGPRAAVTLGLVASAAAAGVARGRGPTPFWCAAAIAGADVALIGAVRRPGSA